MTMGVLTTSACSKRQANKKADLSRLCITSGVYAENTMFFASFSFMALTL